MTFSIGTILSKIASDTTPTSAREATAKYLAATLPKADTTGVKTAEILAPATDDTFMKALGPIVEALQLDPQTTDDQARITRAQQILENLAGIAEGTHTTHCGIQLPAVTNSQEIAKVGDFIHKIWQDTNSYRTRYKDMKVDGQPVTEIKQPSFCKSSKYRH
jgi:hypothetical protein